MLKVSNFSSPGKKGSNQDSILIKHGEELSLLAIADGMGGAYGGAIASKLALMTISEIFDKNQNIDMIKLFENVQVKFQEVGSRLPEFNQMATTLSVCIVHKDFVEVGHVGDTRVYHLRKQGIKYRTKDQTEMQQLLDEGILTKVSAKNYHRKHVLYSVMSGSGMYQLYQTKFEIMKNDRIILLTDGVYNVLDDLVIFRDLSISNSDINKFASEIKLLIEQKGIVDDYSAIFAEI